MKHKLHYIGLLLLLLFTGPSYSQAVSQMTDLDQMESMLFEQLRDLKNSSHQLTVDLKKLQEELKISKETSVYLSNSLESTLIQFEKCAQSLENTKQKLQEQRSKTRRLAICLILIATIAILVRVATVILKAKFGIQLPYWLNVIL